MDRRVGGQNAARLELNLSSVEVGDEAACLPHQCDTRRYIPRRQPMFPIRVQPSGRDPGKIEGCCSKSAQPRDFLLHGGVLIARKNDVPAAGMRKRAGNDRLRKLSACSHPQPAIIEKGAFAPLGREQVVAHRIIDDARNDRALPIERDRDRKMRDAVKKIQRAVERIDDPAVGLVGAFMQPAFLSQEAVAGTCVFELGPQCLFRAPIGGSDEACGPFHRDLQLLDLPEIPLERAACLVRGLDHDVEERGAEHGTGAGQTDYEGGGSMRKQAALCLQRAVSSSMGGAGLLDGIEPGFRRLLGRGADLRCLLLNKQVERNIADAAGLGDDVPFDRLDRIGLEAASHS
jgi:hypothetical protein